MSHQKCQTRQASNYEVKQRYIPTFVHEQIFDEAPLRLYSSRCTPTFHSTVFNTEGYNIKTIHCKNVPSPIQVPLPGAKTLYCNQSQQKRIQDNCRPHKGHNVSRDHWYDHTKQQILSSIPNGQHRGYSRQRKNVDLSSDPVFKDFTSYENKSTVLRITEQPVSQVNKHENQKSQVINQPQVVPVQGLTQPQVLEQVQVNKVGEQSQKNKKRVTVHEENKQENKVKEAKKERNFHGKDQDLKVKGRNPQARPQTGEKLWILQQKPTFTVVRRSRVHEN